MSRSSGAGFFFGIDLGCVDREYRSGECIKDKTLVKKFWNMDNGKLSATPEQPVVLEMISIGDNEDFHEASAVFEPSHVEDDGYFTKFDLPTIDVDAAKKALGEFCKENDLPCEKEPSWYMYANMI